MPVGGEDGAAGRLWLVADPCGLVTATITYLLLMLVRQCSPVHDRHTAQVEYGLLSLLDMSIWWDWLHLAAYTTLAALAAAAHLRAMLTDPGGDCVIPRRPITHGSGAGDRAQPERARNPLPRAGAGRRTVGDDVPTLPHRAAGPRTPLQHVPALHPAHGPPLPLVCSHSRSLRPRASRINNCVGLRNQKYFLLFTVRPCWCRGVHRCRCTCAWRPRTRSPSSRCGGRRASLPPPLVLGCTRHRA